MVSVSAKADLQPENNLRNIDFANGELIDINDGWVLYWNQLLTPKLIQQAHPDIILSEGLAPWNTLEIEGKQLPSFGVATYSTQLILNQTHQPLSVRLPKINSTFKLWINDELVFEAGNVTKDASTLLHRRLETFIPISSDVDTVSLTLQVANYYHRQGGMTQALSIGTTLSLWQQYRNKLISKMILIGCLFFVSVTLLLLYYTYWRKDKAILFLALFSLCWGYRNLSDEYSPLIYLFPTIRWVWLVRIEYISLFFGSLMGLSYLREIFKHIFPSIFLKIAIYFCTPFIVLAVLLPSQYLSLLLLPFFAGIQIIQLYIVFILLTSKKKSKQSILALLGILSGMIVASYHILSFNIGGDVNSVLISIGYLITLILNALLLGERFSLSYTDKEKQQQDTLLQNVKITEKANLLHKTKDLLEGQIALRTKEIENVVLDLKERNNHLEQFNYIVSHNMRAPVSNIIGLTNIYNIKDNQDPFNIITVEKIKESVNALDEVLKDLTGVLEVKQRLNQPNSTVNFKDNIKKIQLSIAKEIDNAGIEFRIDLKVESIVSNNVYWYSILINLISNAIKYSRTDVQSYISIKTFTIEEGHIHVEIQDNGLGIDLTKNSEDVFGLYKRFHNHVEGKGMGLFMVRTQVESMGGHISIDSTPGVGTTFKIVV